MENLPRKRARGKTHTKSENDEEIQTSKKPLNSTVHLTYDVLRIIFRYLNGLDLSRVAMVCRYNAAKCSINKFIVQFNIF